jgi:predicted MFS family arabinose efflux permease
MNPKRSASAWSPLGVPVYRSLWMAALISNIGAWMHDVAAAWLMSGIAPSPLFVSLLQTATSLPAFLLALPGGALADILDRRRLLVGSFAALIVAVASLGLLTFLGWTTAWVLLAFTFLIGIGTGFARPALDALTPEVVDPKELPQAVSLDAVGLNVARAVGGTLGGFAIAALGSGAVFLINAASDIPYILSLLRWKRRPVATGLPPESVGGAVKAGLRYLRFAPALRSVLVRVGAFIFSGCALWSLLPLVARGEMKLSSGGFGLLVGAFGTGALLGALVLPRLRSRVTPDALVAGATLLLAGVLLSLAFVRAFALVAATMLSAGMAWLALMSALNTALQSSIPSWVRARGSALYGLTFMGSMTAGSAVWGILATQTNARTALATASAVSAAGLLLALRYPLLKQKLDLAPSMHWPAPSLEDSASGPDTPVEVTLEYRVDPARAADFIREMEKLGNIRRRDGATAWRLEVDPVEPSHYIETFRLDSWAEHLRQHERVTVEDRALEELTRSFHLSHTPPVVTHRRVTE